VHPVHEALDDACEQGLELLRGRGTHFMEHRHTLEDAINPIEHEAMQMDERDGAGAACWIRNVPMTRWTILTTGARATGDV
jgi:hypothetical protein